MQVFQVVPPVVRNVGNGFEMDADFADSLKIYMDHFESFSIARPVHTSSKLEGSGLQQCVPIRDLPWGEERLKFTPLPTAFRPGEFLKELPRVRRLLRDEIIASEYLIFSPHELIGDWPTIAIHEAIRLGRPYTIEADAVHADLLRKRHSNLVSWKRFVKLRLLLPLFERSIQYSLQRAEQGIFQGQDVYKAYAPFCSVAHKLNHHVPVYSGDHISRTQLLSKLEDIKRGEPLEICYAGRAIDVKGPLEWIDTLSLLAKRGVPFRAKWVGDGPMLKEMKARAAELNVPDLTFAGFVSDRKAVLEEIKKSHIFLFCHNSKESARILGEALACGSPLVGFGSAYPIDLVAEHGGGVFCDIGDVEGLAGKVQALNSNREELADLVASAARSGSDFDRDAALNKRARLVRETAKSSALEP